MIPRWLLFILPRSFGDYLVGLDKVTTLAERAERGEVSIAEAHAEIPRIVADAKSCRRCLCPHGVRRLRTGFWTSPGVSSPCGCRCHTVLTR